jgi:hypothetical protein
MVSDISVHHGRRTQVSKDVHFMAGRKQRKRMPAHLASSFFSFGLLMGVICLLIGYLWKRPHRQTQR